MNHHSPHHLVPTAKGCASAGVKRKPYDNMLSLCLCISFWGVLANLGFYFYILV